MCEFAKIVFLYWEILTLVIPSWYFMRGNCSSMSDRISVNCDSDWVFTSQIRQSHGGPICDFSIDDGCIFAHT